VPKDAIQATSHKPQATISHHRHQSSSSDRATRETRAITSHRTVDGLTKDRRILFFLTYLSGRQTWYQNEPADSGWVDEGQTNSVLFDLSVWPSIVVCTKTSQRTVDGPALPALTLFLLIRVSPHIALLRCAGAKVRMCSSTKLAIRTSPKHKVRMCSSTNQIQRGEDRGTFALRTFAQSHFVRGHQVQICECAKVLEHIRTFAQALRTFGALRGHPIRIVLGRFYRSDIRHRL
jgi:hypothetical protein